jgi:DNA-directed RNA polymerase specialized sigma24 family protein
LDEQAEREFREYVAARHAALFRVALLLAGHREDAEELLQTVFTKLALHWTRAAKSGSVDAYLRKVLYRRQMSWWRSRGRRGVHVAAVLAPLTRRQRALIVLRYHEDLPEEEVAEILGCSLAAVRSQTTRFQPGLRDDLQVLSSLPAPASPGDRALAAARKVGRRRVVVAAAGAVAIAALIAVPVAAGGWHRPLDAAQGGAPCESATDEAEPSSGVPGSDQPQFVKAVVSKLPRTEHYVLQSAYGICTVPGSAGVGPSGYAVINLGPNRERGHLTVSIYYETDPPTCATTTVPADQLFCEDGIANTPLVQAIRDGVDDFVVTAVYPDRRAVSIEAHTFAFDPATLRSVVTDPELVALLPRVSR